MKSAAVFISVFLSLILFKPTTPCMAAALQEGKYEIEVNLKLPYILDTHTRKIERLCLNPDQSPAFGLVVLSSNNPLKKCPIINTVYTANILSFDIICPGENAARAHAEYSISSDSFRGRIKMKMGGKNMTMTEVQVGHRVGSCNKHKTQ